MKRNTIYVTLTALLFTILIISCKKESSTLKGPSAQAPGIAVAGTKIQGFDNRTTNSMSLSTADLDQLDPVPIYDYYNSANGDRYLTGDANFSSPGWTRVGVAFRAYLGNITHLGVIPIYEYYNNVVQDHAYSTDPNDPGILGYPNWFRNTPGPVFYARPNGAIIGSVPVYSYYNASLTAHLYSTDPDIPSKYPGWGEKFLVWYAWLPQ